MTFKEGNSLPAYIFPDSLILHDPTPQIPWTLLQTFSSKIHESILTYRYYNFLHPLKKKIFIWVKKFVN